MNASMLTRKERREPDAKSINSHLSGKEVLSNRCESFDGYGIKVSIVG